MIQCWCQVDAVAMSFGAINTRVRFITLELTSTAFELGKRVSIAEERRSSFFAHTQDVIMRFPDLSVSLIGS